MESYNNGRRIMSMKLILGENIKKARLSCGISQAELAYLLLHKSAAYISFIEAGKRNVTASDLYNISQILNIRIDKLFD